MLEINKIHQGDCLELMKQIEESSIDCIWIDPPYNIDYKYSKYKDKREYYFEWMEKCLEESFRVLKMDGNIFVKMWSKYVFEFGDIFRRIGFVHKNNIIWKRKSCANYNNKFLGGYEIIFFFSKTDSNKWNPEGFLRDTQFLKRWDGTKEYKGRLNDLWDDIKPVTAGNLKHPEGIYIEGTGKKCHPAQHPEELVERCLLCATNKKDIVLDFFSGSGTTGNVCKKIERDFIGIEIDESYCKIAEERLNKLQEQKKLSA